ncbi:intermembrane phospholipid transport protein YdbH family protein [Aurantiacibacter poecillastricola]|uniref:intermembrane phospholipid transport protein YdbH family protein n=1 Tax=Aurantiacibacter poecillastricola TaxID=3064385 RepID=UPI00273F5308|nr:YdbH domain-containing protein [Aurantiacibacter sp. 219JJ12-13]MDP5261744.1 YdbH domain-containing protein [Aurantiacibacter sp. 219JJ12-13]
MKGRKRRMLRNLFRVTVALMLVAVLLAWFQRERIADDFIADAFREQGVEARYRIESIAPGRQILSDIVIGDPENPDLTIERLEVLVTPRFGLPDITELRVIRPRLFGSMRGGQLSFGALDPLIFTGEEGPFEFPSVRLMVEDGRGLLETDYGPVGLKLAGSGHLRGGFSGELAAVAPRLEAGGCIGENVTLYGEVGIDAERPEFRGPLRFAALECEGSGLAIRDAGVALDLQADRNLADFEGAFDFASSSIAFADARAALGGEGRFTWRGDDLNVRYDLAASDADTPYASIGGVGLEGRLRALGNFEQLEVEGELVGKDLRLGPETRRVLARAQAAGEGTLLQPLLFRFNRGLSRHLPGSDLQAEFTARQLDGRSSLVIPQATLRGGEGESLLAVSRARFEPSGEGIPLFSGNFQTGGTGLPRITGRMEQAVGGALELRMAMREYAAGNASLALPKMRLVQGRGGRIAIDGRALVSGEVPGGFVSGLDLPLDATLAPGGSIALWQGCREVRFEELTLANLSLDRDSITICPRRGQPILRSGPGGLQFAGGVDSLDLSGALAETPVRLRSGPLGVAYPGTLAARDLDIELGPEGSAQRFTITDLRADLSADRLGGDFSGADVFLASVPLDIIGASGDWSYAEDRLTLSNGALRIEDREARDRFEPLVARDATLTLFDNLIEANAVLREPVTGRAITRTRIVHDLGTGAGHADLIVDNLTFDEGLQPAPSATQCLDAPGAAAVRPRGLSCLVLGVVSEVRGSVKGTGRIDWNEIEVTSSGEFSADSLDLAAAFGPVQGASGTVVFTDLLGLTTAPNQRLSIAAVNPGIEVFDGEIGFQLIDGEVLAVQGGTWPFMGGTLRLRPLDIRIGTEEVRAYVMEIEGLEASRFVEQMELGNLAASGVFDGVVPIVFDAQGNGSLEGGLLTSRPPGGNVAYIGDLTYEDLGFFANYAFSALRDLSYEQMAIGMDGPLTGELVTQVRFEGIGQGELAESNIVTRAIDDLPIELRINIRAPFYKLITSLRSMYDPAAVRDPRDLGLLGVEGERLRETIDQQTVDEREAEEAAEEARRLEQALDTEQPPIQPQESEPVP